MAALAAAWRLSGDEAIGEVTIYQRGWRLGGKAASSRGENERIEEHGLHVWLGYYDNAFRVMRECYEVLDRGRASPDCPIKGWRDAFVPADAIGLASRTSAGWDEWTAVFSPNDKNPGEPSEQSTAMELADVVIRSQNLVRDFVRSLGSAGQSQDVVLSARAEPPRRPAEGPAVLQRAIDAAAALALETAILAHTGSRLLPVASDASGSALTFGIDRLRALVARRPNTQRMFELVDLVVATLRGIISDGLLVDPRRFNAINGEEYRDWLRRHGASAETLDAPLVHGIYDLVFGFRNGDRSRPSFAAGAGIYLSAKMFFDYKGSIFWKMQAGMGDAVIAPLYQALRARGVRFEFFHDVIDLELAADKSDVDAVRLVRQVGLKRGLEQYEPLALYNGLPCFPSMPIGEQLEDEIAEPRLLETLWGRGADGQTVTIRRGPDYDDLVYAMSVGMVRHTCAELLACDSRWPQMVEHLSTVATQSAQVWMHNSEEDLGRSQRGATVTGFNPPFATVASMSHLLAVERWPARSSPKSLLYLCGTLEEPTPSDSTSKAALATSYAQVRRHLVETLDDSSGAGLLGTPPNGRFDWNSLVDYRDRSGPERVDSQFFVANVDPSDRYVQSLPGSDRYRLRPDQSGFRHLYLAGDWTDCGLNAGCIEAAVISGLQAANAILERDRWAHISGGWKSLTGDL